MIPVSKGTHSYPPSLDLVLDNIFSHSKRPIAGSSIAPICWGRRFAGLVRRHDPVIIDYKP